MPWQGVSPVELRMRFITEYATELYSMTELAAMYGQPQDRLLLAPALRA